MHRPAPNIYHGHLIDLVPDVIARLKKLARTKGDLAIYITNGHGAWEAAIANTLSPGDLVLVPATGHFALGWAEVARAMGVETEIMDFGLRDTIDTEALTDRLRADAEGRIKAVLAVQTDTSTGVRNDIPALRVAIDAAEHPTLLMVDCMASFGCDRFEMDTWGVDLMITGSQKGLMTPPGLGFVFFNVKADRARDTARSVTHYWDWRPRVDPDIFYRYFCGTAPTHHLYGLDEALRMIEEETIDAVWQRHAALARAVWAAFDHWGQIGPTGSQHCQPGTSLAFGHCIARRFRKGHRTSRLVRDQNRPDTWHRTWHDRAWRRCLAQLLSTGAHGARQCPNGPWRSRHDRGWVEGGRPGSRIRRHRTGCQRHRRTGLTSGALSSQY